jgi:hypothetical protein
MGRRGFRHAEQITDGVAFHVSRATGYMTGSTVPADGGCSLFQLNSGTATQT